MAPTDYTPLWISCGRGAVRVLEPVGRAVPGVAGRGGALFLP
jgi:hypothetical protein